MLVAVKSIESGCFLSIIPVMTRRWGIFLHRLGLALAVFSVVGAVLLNAGAFQLRLEARKNLRALAPETSELQTELAEAYGNARDSAENLRRSLTFGGIWVVGGLFAYGLGLSARNAAGGRRQRRRRR